MARVNAGVEQDFSRLLLRVTAVVTLVWPAYLQAAGFGKLMVVSDCIYGEQTNSSMLQQRAAHHAALPRFLSRGRNPDIMVQEQTASLVLAAGMASRTAIRMYTHQRAYFITFSADALAFALACPSTCWTSYACEYGVLFSRHTSTPLTPTTTYIPTLLTSIILTPQRLLLTPAILPSLPRYL